VLGDRFSAGIDCVAARNETLKSGPLNEGTGANFRDLKSKTQNEKSSRRTCKGGREGGRKCEIKQETQRTFEERERDGYGAHERRIACLCLEWRNASEREQACVYVEGRRRDHDGAMERQRDTLRDIKTKITYGQSRY
jgi:hypothetical protein